MTQGLQPVNQSAGLPIRIDMTLVGVGAQLGYGSKVMGSNPFGRAVVPTGQAWFMPDLRSCVRRCPCNYPCGGRVSWLC